MLRRLREEATTKRKKRKKIYRNGNKQAGSQPVSIERQHMSNILWLYKPRSVYRCAFCREVCVRVFDIKIKRKIWYCAKRFSKRSSDDSERFFIVSNPIRFKDFTRIFGCEVLSCAWNRTNCLYAWEHIVCNSKDDIIITLTNSNKCPSRRSDCLCFV